jgi:hypothetical protein
MVEIIQTLTKLNVVGQLTAYINYSTSGSDFVLVLFSSLRPGECVPDPVSADVSLGLTVRFHVPP